MDRNASITLTKKDKAAAERASLGTHGIVQKDGRA